ncbi:MAG TPA: TonB-dependent receptor [Vicinamibacterales bacterium]|nr:TonB-dependent receptor [Vicinamibacterales bacterium]
MTGTIRHWLGIAGVICAVALYGSTAIAQESRGSIAGLIVDSSGGALPGVTVTVTNNGTNGRTVIVTNETGQYTALFLLPGSYRVTAELSGFQTRDHSAVIVRVGERLQLDMTLSPAGVAEQVSVVAEAPQLETSTASLGQVITSKLISEIPLGDGTAYGLTRLVAGATFERSYALQRPMDNDNLRGAAVTGTLNSEFTIDGSSNIVSQARVGIQPPADAIEEFKVETAAYDAQIGHTGAGGVNLALKSGTNSLHGALSFYNRDDSRSASLFASNRLGTSKQPRDYNRFSGMVSGPIFKNKTFFMFSYEKLQDDTVEALTTSVPTSRMRSGDFGELLPLGVQIYDPATAQLVNGVVTRQPFSGNVIPANRINPIAANILKYFPAPNAAAAADLSSNYFIEQPWTYGYDFQMVRIDHEWAQNHRTYGRFIRNFRREERFNFAGVQNGTEITRGSTDRFNYNWAGGHTAVLSPTMVLDLKGSWLRFNDDLFPLYDIDLSTLGYSPSTLGLLGDFEQLPRYSIESTNATTAGRVATLGAQQSGFNNGRTQPFYNVQFAATATKTTGAHTMKFGYDWRSLRQKETNLGWRGGAYAFDSSYTRSTAAATGQYGQGIASFLLGLPNTTSFIELRPDYDTTVISHGFFVHDDWRVNDRLTLNLGLRYDLELGMTESEDRNIGPFDLTTPNPIQAAAQARFASSPPAGVPGPASQFHVLGGYTYLSSDQSQAWNADLNNFQPRVGIAFKIDDRTVLRGGTGKFVAPFQLQGVPGLISGINQIGYSRNTPVPVTSDQGLTFQANLSNPVPSGQLVQPVGSSQGLSTNLGNAPGNIWNADRVNPEFWRFSIGVERQLPWEMLFEVSYIGQHGSNQAILEPLNFVPQQYRTQSLIRDNDAETFLTQTVSNPFQGLTPDSPATNGATIARRRLLYAYPQFETSGAPCATGTSTTFCMETARGTNMYNGAIFRLDKRFTNGLMLMTSYTWSHLTEKVAPLNPWDELEDRIGATDRPHRITLASVAELPFGRGRRYGDGWNAVTDAILGGWQFSTKYEWQSGSPLVFNQNTYFDPQCGDPKQLKSQWGGSGNQIYGVDLPIIDISCFYTMNGQPFRNATGQPVTFTAAEIQLGQANLRKFPTTLPDVRFMEHHLLDLGVTKNFPVGDRVRVQVRIEALNATNYTLFGVGNMVLTPNNAQFMKLNNIDSSTVMKPRDIQIGARVTF